MMISVNNGIGGTVTVTYTPAAQLPGAINALNTLPYGSRPNAAAHQLATKVTTTDGRGGSYNTTYQYTDGRWFSGTDYTPGTIPNRRNLGFATITVTDGQTHQYTTTTYNQTPGFEGHISEVDVYTSDRRLFNSTTYTYDLVDPNSGQEAVTGQATEFVREKQKTISNYNYVAGSIVNSQTTTVQTFDNYGNPSVVNHDD